MVVDRVKTVKAKQTDGQLRREESRSCGQRITFFFSHAACGMSVCHRNLCIVLKEKKTNFCVNMVYPTIGYFYFSSGLQYTLTSLKYVLTCFGIYGCMSESVGHLQPNSVIRMLLQVNIPKKKKW